jgi:hypothetical protein
MTDMNHPVNGRPMKLELIPGGFAAKVDTCDGCVCNVNERCLYTIYGADHVCDYRRVFHYADSAPEASRCPDCGVTPGNGPTSCECEVTS